MFKTEEQEKVLFQDAAGKDSITRFDKKNKKRKKNKKKKEQKNA